MAERRMLTKKVTDADEFISLSSSAQALYLHLNQGADDDGFCNQVQLAMYKAHACTDDLIMLLQKRYLLQFESGVIVIKHWRMSNALRKDRYTPTSYQDELKQLKIKDNGAYTLSSEEWLPSGCQTVAVGKDRLGKVSTGKDSIDKDLYGEFNNVALTTEEYDKLKEKFDDYEERIERLSSYIASKGKKYKSHYATILTWAKKDVPKSSISKEF